jgi:hypothetical protein
MEIVSKYLLNTEKSKYIKKINEAEKKEQREA